jgi:putative (di)nucleoside polyphosphate hydrolase
VEHGCCFFVRVQLAAPSAKLFIWMIPPVIDSDGFRPNVGIILTNDQGQLLWARRVGGHDAWQFPQGGINPNETPEQALYRELYEEVGLRREDVEILACTRGWLRYRLPHRLVRHNSMPLCVGQKQKWFLLRLRSDDNKVSLNNGGRAEFDDWRWVSYWYPLGKVVSFKRDVYRRALKELSLFHSLHEDRRTRAR